VDKALKRSLHGSYDHRHLASLRTTAGTEWLSEAASGRGTWHGALPWSLGYGYRSTTIPQGITHQGRRPSSRGADGSVCVQQLGRAQLSAADERIPCIRQLKELFYRFDRVMSTKQQGHTATRRPFAERPSPQDKVIQDACASKLQAGKENRHAPASVIRQLPGQLAIV